MAVAVAVAGLARFVLFMMILLTAARFAPGWKE